MKLHYYTDKFTVYDEGSCSGTAANVLLTPVRWLVGGRSYLVSRPGGLLDTTDENRCLCIGKRIIGFLGTLLVFPVLIGLLVKKLSQRSIENYDCVRTLLDTGATVLKTSQLYQAPSVKCFTPDLNQDVDGINLNDLLDIWDRVGISHPEYQSKKNALEQWLNKVPNPSEYNYIEEQKKPYAAKQLLSCLKLIIRELDKDGVFDNKKESVILALLDAASVCSPTWLEVAAREYQDLTVGKETERDVFLRFFQKAKEERILEIAKNINSEWHWHVLNYLRKTLGDELGLDKSMMDFDEVTRLSPHEKKIYSKNKCLTIFYQELDPDSLAESIATKINMEYEDTSGFVQNIADLVDKAAQAHAVQSGIDIESCDFDSSSYALGHFYETVRQVKRNGRELRFEEHYYITTTAVLWILWTMGFLAQPPRL